MTAYRPREIGARVVAALDEMPAVVLTGLRQAGKSTLLENEPALNDRRYVTLDDFARLEEARRDPDGFVAGDEPLTIDEVQRCPELLVAVKRRVDRDRRPGHYLLSGSANLALLRSVSESLAGRAVYFELHPFTRRELTGRLHRHAFLRRLFENGELEEDAGEPVTPDEILRGGMPPVALRRIRDAALWFTGYEQTYLERDVRELTQVADLVSFRQLLRLAALRTGQVLKQSELARDAKLTAITAGRYMNVLEASFLVSRLPPFLGNRASRVIKSPKLFVADSGLACHLVGVDRLDGDADEPLRGALLETYVAYNLAGILAAGWPGARLRYWSVQGRHEVDFVIEVGRDCLAIEVKAGARWDDRDLVGLRRFLESTRRCRAAVLAHGGRQVARLGERLFAVPAGLLLS